MKILHVASEYPPAKVYGLGRFVHGLARAQAELGDAVAVLTNSHGGAEDDVRLAGVNVHRIAFPNPPRPASGHGEVFQFNQYLVARAFDRRERFDGVEVVASHDWLTAITARELARELGVPLVVTFHDEVVGKHFGLLGAEARLVRDLEALTAHDATRVIANSRFIAAQVVDHYGIPEERVHAIHGGIDPALLDVASPDLVRSFRAALASDEELLVTYVGRLDPEKGLGTFAEAAVAAGRESPELRFVVAGSGREESQLASRLAPLGPRARLLGYARREVLAHLYRAADVVVVPSLYEPFGLVALQALHAGAAVVASAVGGLGEIVREGEGVLVPPGDPGALASALVTLARDPLLRSDLRARGELRARRDFGWPQVALRTRQVYLEAARDPRPLATEPVREPPRPLVSVTIATYDAPAHVETTLRTLFGRTDYPALEAVVVDDASSPTAYDRLERTVSDLRSRGHAITLVRNAENHRFSRCQNQAIGLARGEYVCLLNDDTEIPEGSEGWLRALVWTLEHYRAGSVTPVSTFRDGRIYWAGSTASGWHAWFDHPDRPDFVPAPARTHWNNMACFLTRRSYFSQGEVGPLREDADHAQYESDREWCLRLADRLGLAHWVHPVRIHHYSAESPRRPGFQHADQSRIPASIVMVVHNALAYTRDAVDSVLSSTRPPFELVLVDNGSDVETRAYLEALRDRLGGAVAVQLLRNERNEGYPIAANQGLRGARGRSVVLLNNDVRVRSGWLEALIAASHSRPRVGIVTAKILNFDGTVQNAGGILHHPDGSFTIPHANEDRLAPPVTRQTEVQNAGGPCMLLTRGLLDEVGVFDEAYSPAYFEDSDLCQRARAAGFVLLYEPRAEVLHHGKATANVVAREGTLDVWGGFEANRRRFHERWREQLAADEASRREPPAARKKILLCYGREATTTAAYCEAALRRSHDVVTAGPGQELDLGDVTAAELVREAGGADLLLAIEGRNYLPREVEGAPCPTAWWAIDAHLHARAEEEGYFEVARAFEHVFLAQRDHARSFAARGIETTWLPLACDPDVHVPGEAPKDLDVVFLGNVLPIHGRRRALLERLRRRFRVHATRGVYREDMARLYSRARVVWNCSLAGDLNMRVFEALASGTVLVTDRIANGLEAFFAHGEHLLLYDDGDLEEVVAGALAEPRASAEIAARGQRLVTRHHTYAHRMADVVRIATRRREGAHVSRSPRHSSTASGSTRSRSASRS